MPRSKASVRVIWALASVLGLYLGSYLMTYHLRSWLTPPTVIVLFTAEAVGIVWQLGLLD
jgi:disulfide bond formation protein DsbB